MNLFWLYFLYDNTFLPQDARKKYLYRIAKLDHHMKKRIVVYLTLVCSCFYLVPTVLAHVPYLEHSDLSVEQPFQVRKSIVQSIAVYSWLTTDGINPSTDIDVYSFTLKNQPLRIYLEVIVPVCDGYYANFTPWFETQKEKTMAVLQFSGRTNKTRIKKT